MGAQKNMHQFCSDTSRVYSQKFSRRSPFNPFPLQVPEHGGAGGNMEKLVQN
jgi:hypothetical protein